MILIELPEFNFDVTFETIKNIPFKKSGIYIFFDRENQPLYVGQASCLRTRVRAHFNGYSNNTSRYTWALYRCKAFIEADQLNKNIYELFLINQLKCPLNSRLNSYGYKGHNFLLDEADPDNLQPAYCQFILKDKKQCSNRPHSNGFCHLHGGNGQSRKAIIDKAIEDSYFD